jgi:hypothetical protein
MMEKNRRILFEAVQFCARSSPLVWPRLPRCPHSAGTMSPAGPVSPLRPSEVSTLLRMVTSLPR